MHGNAVHVVRWSIRQFLPIELAITTCSSVELSTFQDIKPGANASGFSFGAPGRAHLLEGESPLHPRQGEVLAERQLHHREVLWEGS